MDYNTVYTLKDKGFHEHSNTYDDTAMHKTVGNAHLLKASSSLRVLGVEVEVCLADALECATGGG